MIHMIQNAKDQAVQLTLAAYRAAVAAGQLPEAETLPPVPVEIPKDTRNGDFTTTFALAAAKALRMAPRNLAQALLDNLQLDGSYFASAEIAGPGFLNFRLGQEWFRDVMAAVESEGADYGTSDTLKGQKIMVEFVSANPTGPMHMGNARGGVLGDTLAAVLAACGADVSREFYVNDAGHQIDKFAHSIEARYLQLLWAEANCPIPADCYDDKGIRELAWSYYFTFRADEKHPIPAEAADRQADMRTYAQDCPPAVRLELDSYDMDKLLRTMDAWYLRFVSSEENVPIPADGYQGGDIRDLALAYYEANGALLQDVSAEERQEKLAAFGLSMNLPRMKEDLQRYKISYDQWFYESTLHESGYVAETAEMLTANGWTYEKDGALWLRTADIMRQNLLKAGKKQADVDKLDLKDDVLRRANGFYTYFAADIAYHRNKFAVRGFDRVINIWGADHHGHVARLKGALDALDLDGTGRLDIVLMQLVKLLRDGKPVRMSKRTGKAVSLRDLLDEVSVDAARWYFNAKPDTQMEFDLGLAVREDSENPIYYVEYAHARICSLLRATEAEGVSVPAMADVDIALLNGETETALIKQLSQYCEEIRLAARDYDPSHINRYLMELAACFHRFYGACRIKGEDAAVAAARLKLADCTRAVLCNGLKLIGVEAPEKM